jgi:deoxyhypusine synthase
VPIFCPGDRRFVDRHGPVAGAAEEAGAGYIDIIGDIVESANLVIRRPRTASVVLGGGTPKNFINQASVQAEFYSDEVGGHRYALQIVTDVPHFGGASRLEPRRGAELGQAGHRFRARCRCSADATIALPLLATALARPRRRCSPRDRRPIFTLAGRVMTVDGQTVPTNASRK